jgi:post-segregation antitoxin (ccd killing protein)
MQEVCFEINNGLYWHERGRKMENSLKRISVMIREDQYNQLNQKGLNLSGLVRDLIDDHLSEHKITLSVSEETMGLYNLIVSNTGSTDLDVEHYLKDTLKLLLRDKIKNMQELEKKFFGNDGQLKGN